MLGQRKTGISCSQIGGKRHELCFMEATGGMRRKKFTLWLTLSFFILIGMTKARQHLVYDVDIYFLANISWNLLTVNWLIGRIV